MKPKQGDIVSGTDSNGKNIERGEVVATTRTDALVRTRGGEVIAENSRLRKA